MPLTGTASLVIAVVFGFIFGLLLHRGGVTSYNVIVNQFRFKDFTVLKIMLTAIVVGGIGVLALKHWGYAKYDIKPAQMVGVTLGAAVFGAGMVVYGYCPGTGLAAVATGSLHALVGFAGMLVGGILYALSFPWVNNRILSLAKLKEQRLPELVQLPDWVYFVALAGIALVVFAILAVVERRPRAA